MLFIILNILVLILFIYLIIAFGLFISFLFRFNYLTMTITRYDLNTKSEITGFKKLKWIIICSLIWPVAMHFGEGE